jgi:hypothetical protein
MGRKVLVGAVVLGAAAGACYYYFSVAPARVKHEPPVVVAPLPAPAAVERLTRTPVVPTAPAVAPLPVPAAPVSNIPTGPAVAPLPTRYVPRPAPPPAVETVPTDVPPPVKPISLDNVTKDIDLKTRGGLDTLERSKMKPTDFKADKAPH